MDANKISVLFQENRRAGDKVGIPRTAEIIMDEQTRETFGALIAETAGHVAAETVTTFFQKFGVDPVTHAKQHQEWDAVVSWVTAQRELAVTQKRNIEERMRQRNEILSSAVIKPTVSVIYLLLIGSIIFGMGKAIVWLMPALMP